MNYEPRRAMLLATAAITLTVTIPAAINLTTAHSDPFSGISPYETSAPLPESYTVCVFDETGSEVDCWYLGDECDAGYENECGPHWIMPDADDVKPTLWST